MRFKAIKTADGTWGVWDAIYLRWVVWGLGQGEAMSEAMRMSRLAGT
jgi:hypothetical protein